MEGGLSSPGVETHFRQINTEWANAWGIRGLGGVVFELGPALAVVPRLTAATHTLSSTRHVITVADTKHRFETGLRYFGLGLGCELQFVKRMLVVSAEGGYGSLWVRDQDSTTPELELAIDKLEGGFGRGDIGVRLPSDSAFGGGLSLGFEGFWNLTGLSPSYRISLAAYLEWDMTRL
jgi:hypothetical protein